MIDFPDFLFLVSLSRILGLSRDRIPVHGPVETTVMVKTRLLPRTDPDLNDRVPNPQGLPAIVTIGVLAIFIAQRPEIRLFYPLDRDFPFFRHLDAFIMDFRISQGSWPPYETEPDTVEKPLPTRSGS